MKTYQFSTRVEDGSTVSIPNNLAKAIPNNTPVRVILMVDESGSSSAMSSWADVESLIDEIKKMPSTSSNIQIESGLLAEHLGTSTEQPDSTFNVDAWNETWDSLEEKMDADELADEYKDSDL